MTDLATPSSRQEASIMVSTLLAWFSLVEDSTGLRDDLLDQTMANSGTNLLVHLTASQRQTVLNLGNCYFWTAKNSVNVSIIIWVFFERALFSFKTNFKVELTKRSCFVGVT